MALTSEFPTINEFAANQVKINGKIEIVWQPLFDWNIYPLAGLPQLNFFQVPQGAGFSSQNIAAAAPKMQADTNMTQNGQLPNPQAFWIDGMEFEVECGSTATANLFATRNPGNLVAAATAAVEAGEIDANRILSSGGVYLTIMQKLYYTESPLYRFPPHAGPCMDIALASNDTVGAGVAEVVKTKLGAEGWPVRFDPGLGVASMMNFMVSIVWPALVPLTTFNARIGATLNGWLFRAAQ